MNPALSNPAAAPDIDAQAIRAAYGVIREHVRRTPVLDIRGEDLGIGPCTVVLKLELHQHSGSFKARGAFANLLLRDVPAAGVAAASGGNHGLAVAYAAMRLRIPARIFVPKVASPSKIERIRACGADLVVTGDLYADALAASREWIESSGALAVHAYDQRETLLGQGSVALELAEQAPGLDAVLVAVGGGGLIGGVAAWYAGGTRVVGVEPEEAPTLFEALRAGRPVDARAGGVAADSLAPRRVGDLMFPIARRFSEGVVLVRDEEIRRAQQSLWDAARIAAEPGGAAAMAALISGRHAARPGERIGVIVCGGNTEAVRFS